MGRSSVLFAIGAAIGAALLTWTLVPRAGAPDTSELDALRDRIAQLERENDELRQDRRRARRAVPSERPPPATTTPGRPEADAPARQRETTDARASRAAAARTDVENAKRAAAAVVRSRSAAELVQAMRDAAPNDERALRDLAKLLVVGGHGPDALPHVVGLVRDTDVHEAARLHALRVLAMQRVENLHYYADEILVRAGEPAKLRVEAIRTAGEVARRGGTLIPIVESILWDPEAPAAEREAALRAMLVGNPDAAIPIVRRLLATVAAEQQAWITGGLHGTRDERLLPLLVEIVNRKPPPENVVHLMNTIAATKDRAWSAKQIIGPPDTPIGGDHHTAWASRSAEMGDVWVELDFVTAVEPRSLRVHESYNPGAISRVEAKNPDGGWNLLWEGTADRVEAPRWFDPPLNTIGYATKTIRLIVATARVKGWNEIDAVELSDGSHAQWASAARASSSYADR